jgi:hypothetical protein
MLYYLNLSPSDSSRPLYINNAANTFIIACVVVVTGSYALQAELSGIYIYRCHVIQSMNAAAILLIHSSATVVFSFLRHSAASKLGTGVSLTDSSYLLTAGGCSNLTGFDYGIYVGRLSSANLHTSSGKSIINANRYGVYATNGGQVANSGTVYNYYVDNTTDRYADSSSYGYYS